MISGRYEADKYIRWRKKASGEPSFIIPEKARPKKTEYLSLIRSKIPRKRIKREYRLICKNDETAEHGKYRGWNRGLREFVYAVRKRDT